MRLIHDDEVEAAYREFLVFGINHFNHRLVGGEYEPCVKVAFTGLVAQATAGDVGQ